MLMEDVLMMLSFNILIVQIMFIGMSFCLPIAYWEQNHLKKKKISPDPAQDPLLALVNFNLFVFFEPYLSSSFSQMLVS